jgi:5-(carboxyamino)imidazole ribonucleotide synthase
MKSPRVGIIGAGQLGRMLALAAYPLGVNCRFLDPSAASPGGQLGRLELAAFDDNEALSRRADATNVVTFDIENVSVDALKAIAKRVPVHPAPAVVAAAQDRIQEKALFGSLAIPTAPFVKIDNDDDLRVAADRLGWPIVLKARRLGYDGRGQRLAHSAAELTEGWASLQRAPSIAETWIKFDCEVSMIAVRSAEGQTAFYALTENTHGAGILLTSVAPFDAKELEQTAREWLDQIMQRFDYRGVLTVEFFVTADGLIANEMAPRVHNSGHWTIEGSETSQFENHIRAILGLPLGSTAQRGHAAMLNLLGRLPPRTELLRLDGLHLHEYGKSPRPRRKLGHCTLVDSDRTRLMARLEAARRVVDASSAGTE